MRRKLRTVRCRLISGDSGDFYDNLCSPWRLFIKQMVQGGIVQNSRTSAKTKLWMIVLFTSAMQTPEPTATLLRDRNEQHDTHFALSRRRLPGWGRRPAQGHLRQFRQKRGETPPPDRLRLCDQVDEVLTTDRTLLIMYRTVRTRLASSRPSLTFDACQGIVSFMAIDVLRAPGSCEHRYFHDLESLIYVLCYLCSLCPWSTGFDKDMEISGKCIATWLAEEGDSFCNIDVRKSDTVSSREVFSKRTLKSIQPAFAPLADFSRAALTSLTSACGSV